MSGHSSKNRRLFRVLKLLWKFTKLSTFALVVLILSSTIEFSGKTVSDHIKETLAQARRSDWAQEVSPEEAVLKVERFHKTERQKLRALIQQLNQPTTVQN